MRLGPVEIFLESRHEVVREGWQAVLGDFPKTLASGAARGAVRLEFSLAHTLPPLGQVTRIYSDPNEIVDVYRSSAEDGATILHFLQGALVWLWPGKSDEARGVVTPNIFQGGRLEDVTYASLAPLLRRHVTYLIHAAAVHTDAGAILLIGPSHSGKTTTGLSLVLSGCKHLASDIVALSLHEGRVLAHPTAGTSRIRQHTLELLPTVRRLAVDPSGSATRINMRADSWGATAPVAALFFPSIAANGQSSLEALPEALALAHVMEESIDRWDGAVLAEHIDFLTALTRQARCFQLHLAPQFEHVQQLIQSAL